MEPILVWRFYEAPEEYRSLSTNGGDEDWLALVPASMANDWIPWLDVGPFGCCSVEQCPLPNDEKHVVFIGCHT